jgi:16S rRNA (cytosine967-C5)-methyltransferase
MPAQSPKAARLVAAEILNRFDPKRNYAGPILAELLPQTQERQRTTDFVFGTIRNRSAIDRVITTFSGRPVERIPITLLNIIRLAGYELVYCPETPEYSVVNEAVENAKAVSGKKQTAFVNAVLRQITRHISNRSAQLSQADLASTLPQTAVSYCEFDSKFLPDPDASPADYLAAAFSLPKWLITDWLSEYGLEDTRQICFASNRRPSIYVRPNTLKITAQELAEHFRRAGIDHEIVPEVEMIRIKSPQDITQVAGFAQGLFSVQDITASRAGRVVWAHLRGDGGQSPLYILDLCAAPGTKTTQLAELTGDSAKIIATDIDSRRLEKVKENIARLGIRSVEIIPYEGLFANHTSRLAEPGAATVRERSRRQFDAILLDVPCSNTGVLARRPEARYRIKPKAIMQLTETQAELLQKAAALVRPGGTICYSTCSIQRAENNELVRQFLAKNADFDLRSEELRLPSAEQFDHDGGYAAILVKKS